MPFLDHHTGVGGRYSVLTNVGLLPAAVARARHRGDPRRRGRGLRAVPRRRAPREAPAALGAALNLAFAMEGKGITVLMAYADRLERFTRWWVQLWAESLGKDGKGSQPVAAIGPVDQHSPAAALPRRAEGQALHDPDRRRGGAGAGDRRRRSRARAGEPGFAGRRIGDLVAAQGRATADTLARNGRPTRRLHVERLDERAMGELLMHFMLETILTGYALGVDPVRPAGGGGGQGAGEALSSGEGAA